MTEETVAHVWRTHTHTSVAAFGSRLHNTQHAAAE